jgi:transcriptional regulator with XRE-family HTH domain
MDMREYEAHIRSHREKAYLTQQQVAAELKMSRATISQIESGVIGEIGVRKLSHVCARLGLVIQIVPRRTPPLAEALRAYTDQRVEALRLSSEILSGKPARKKS